MKRLIFILSLTLFTLASCGKESAMKPLATEKNALGAECACNTIYSPICGSDNKDYENSCIASCYKATEVKQGSCKCSDEKKVCGSDNNTYTECDAQKAIATGLLVKIKQFAECGVTAY